MKMLNKKIVYALLAVIMLDVSCSESQKKKMEGNADTMKANVENKVEEVKEDNRQREDNNFVKDVIEGNTKELHLLDLAIKKGTAKDVKTAAKEMKPDHEKMGTTFNSYASKKNITVTVDSSSIKSNFDDDKPGADWDKSWVDKMVDEHQKLVDKFEKYNATDPELKSMISESLPTLRKHLDMCKKMQGKMKM